MVFSLFSHSVCSWSFWSGVCEHCRDRLIAKKKERARKKKIVEIEISTHKRPYCEVMCVCLRFFFIFFYFHYFCISLVYERAALLLNMYGYIVSCFYFFFGVRALALFSAQNNTTVVRAPMQHDWICGHIHTYVRELKNNFWHWWTEPHTFNATNHPTSFPPSRGKHKMLFIDISALFFFNNSAH